MKNWFKLLIAFGLSFSLFACSNSEVEKEEVEQVEEEESVVDLTSGIELDEVVYECDEYAVEFKSVPTKVEEESNEKKDYYSCGYIITNKTDEIMFANEEEYENDYPIEPGERGAGVEFKAFDKGEVVEEFTVYIAPLDQKGNAIHPVTLVTGVGEAALGSRDTTKNVLTNDECIVDVLLTTRLTSFEGEDMKEPIMVFTYKNTSDKTISFFPMHDQEIVLAPGEESTFEQYPYDFQTGELKNVTLSFKVVDYNNSEVTGTNKIQDEIGYYTTYYTIELSPDGTVLSVNEESRYAS